MGWLDLSLNSRTHPCCQNHLIRAKYLMALINALLRKIIRPVKQYLWKKKREPFIHKGESGILFRLNPPEYVDSSIYTEGLFELNELRFMGKSFKGRTLLDVGANIGNHALYLSRNFDTVHCFEPNPIALSRLRDNVALNKSNIIIHEVGLGTKDDNLPFYPAPGDNLGGGGFKPNGVSTAVLPIRRGDTYLSSKDITNIDFIKIDVEGFEPDVLEGLAQTILHDRPVIVFEYDGTKQSFDRYRMFLPNYKLKELKGPPWAKYLSPIDNPNNSYYDAIFAFPEESQNK